MENGESQSEQNTGPKVLVVFCTYNERHNLPIAYQQLKETLPDASVLVVDDNSPDQTGDWVKEQQASNPKLHLLSRSGKLGLGSALHDAISWCVDREFEFLINLDADLSHDPKLASQMLAACQESSVAVSVGSRYIDGGGFEGVPWFRRLISLVLNRYAIWLLRLPITDCSGSYRCYRTEALKMLDLGGLKCKGYGFLEEILVALQRKGCTFAEVPLKFETRLSGHSKLTVADAIGALKTIHMLALRR